MREVMWKLFAAMSVFPLTALSQTTPSSFTMGYRYDAMQRVTGVISPDPDGAGSLNFPAVRTTYDSMGRVVRTEHGELSSWKSESIAPANWSGFAIFKVVETDYDSGGKVLKEVLLSAGSAFAMTQYGYDARGRNECAAIRMNVAAYGSLPNACALGTQGGFGEDRITRTVYDAAGQVTKIQKAYGTASQQDYATYTYTQNGMQQYVTDSRQNRSLMLYDGFDRLSDVYFPSKTVANTVSSGDFEHYEYDANGNRENLRKRDTRHIGYAYDALNRLTSKSYPDGGGGASDVNYSYDLMGRMTAAKFPSDQGVSRVFDGFGGVTSDTVVLPGINVQLTYLYNPNGFKKQLTFSGNSVFYEYDQLDRPWKVWRDSSLLATYTYNRPGQRSNLDGGFTTSYRYDSVGRMTNEAISPIAVNSAVELGFSYNPASQITREWRDNAAFVWAGAIVGSDTYTTNGLNQYTSVQSTSTSHDENGNMTDDGAGSTYSYDIENRLVSATGARVATLSYDPLGRLYEVIGSVGGVSTTTKFIYDGDALVQETDASGSILRRYIHGAETSDDPIAWYEGASMNNSSERFLRADHLGSVVVVANHDTSVIHGVNTYDEFGVPASGNIGRFQYTGQAWIPELGLYHYKARVYAPRLGRFMQTDPVGYSDDLNLYSYVGNDPINGIDPTGMFCWAINSSNRFCERSARYERLDGDARISSRTSFFGAAAVVTAAFGGWPQNQFMHDLSAKLESANTAQAEKIKKGTLYNGGTITSNTDRFVEFEQELVQQELVKLWESDREKYSEVVNDANAKINGPLSVGAKLDDRLFAKAVAATQKALGGNIKFENENHRRALGKAVAREVESSRNCTETRTIACD